MESYRIENLSFSYPYEKNKALNGINITVKKGQFVTLCGKSGCGKTTLLRLLKPTAAPNGILNGKIYFENKLISEWDDKGHVSGIGYVMQSPENQIVTDKVWHELAFGLESLGYSNPEIRVRVAEMAAFFGIQTWFHKKTAELSGGQKQLLNLASVMVMQPSVLILDEPTSQLDPIAAQEFIKTLEKINHELGTTIILSEHRLEEAFPVSDRVMVMENGRIICDSKPSETGQILKSIGSEMYEALPAPMRVYGALGDGTEYPVTVCDGREWLENYNEKHAANIENKLPFYAVAEEAETVIELRDVWFRYEKNSADVLKGMNMKIKKGEFFAIVGGNGTGKTTALSIMSGLNIPYRGKVMINGRNISETENIYDGVIGVLPQNPQTLFMKKTIALDLESTTKKTKRDIKEKVFETAALCGIEHLLERHPYDISGGEQQRAALAKVLLRNPEILLLDEPTKGMDAAFKEEFAQIIKQLCENGTTVVAVSHDIEFCAEYADKCAMIFDGSVTSSGTPREFFAGKSFYTTAANRMARGIVPQAVTASDIISAYGGKVKRKYEKTYIRDAAETESIEKNKKKKNPGKIALGCIFVFLFIFTEIFKEQLLTKINTETFQIFAIAECWMALMFFLPLQKTDINAETDFVKRFDKRHIMPLMFILVAVPCTIYAGIYLLHDKKYYFISLMIILETFFSFCMAFEKRKPDAKEIVTVSVVCALAVAGRAAFYMLPEFKASAAIIIISGICMGSETGFLVGVITGFVSNFFFGQGPWTPWQMFSFGIIGWFAGILYRCGFVKKKKISLCIYGFVSVFLIYGIIMNTATVIMTQPDLNFEMIRTSCILGMPFDFVHAVSTVFFLWFAAEPVIEKIERIKVKYGLFKV